MRSKNIKLGRWLFFWPTEIDKYMGLPRYIGGGYDQVWWRIYRKRKTMTPCPRCKGKGTVPVTIIDVTADFECPKCDGRGVG